MPSADCSIQTFWQSELAITWPQLHHNFTKRLNFLPPAPLSACAALQARHRHKQVGEEDRRIHLIQREELLAPTVSCTVKQSTSPAQDCASGGAWDKVSAAEEKLPLRLDLHYPSVLLLCPGFGNGPWCLWSSWLPSLAWLWLPACWGKLTVKPELLYSPLSSLSCACSACQRALWTNLLMHCSYTCHVTTMGRKV